MIRKAVVNDAENLAKLIIQVERESDYMLYESGERSLTETKQRKMIESLSAQSNAVMLIAEQKSQLIGYLFAIGGTARRTQHSAYLVIGIHPAYRGKGVGSELFAELEIWAVRHGIHRLELTVVCKNKAGLALYEKYGFEIEGTKRDSLKMDGIYYDEYYMGKLL